MANEAGLGLLSGPCDLAAAGYKGERAVLLAPSGQPAPAALGKVGRDLLQKLGMDVDFRSGQGRHRVLECAARLSAAASSSW